jgi:hypothetical protein
MAVMFARTHVALTPVKLTGVNVDGTVPPAVVQDCVAPVMFVQDALVGSPVVVYCHWTVFVPDDPGVVHWNDVAATVTAVAVEGSGKATDPATVIAPLTNRSMTSVVLLVPTTAQWPEPVVVFCSRPAVPASVQTPEVSAESVRLGRLSPALAVNLPGVVLPKSKIPLVVPPPSLRTPAVAEVLPPSCPDDILRPLPEPAKT